MNRNLFPLLSAALGFWLVAFPLTFDYHYFPIETSDMIAGLALILLGLLSVSPRRVWPGWIIGLVGIWLQVAPLVFWAPVSLMYINDTFVGALAIVFSFSIAKKGKSEKLSAIFPLGWSYNPSGWEQRVLTVALAMLCWFFSRYMAAFQLGYIDRIWDPFFPQGTFHVITSSISKDFPVSDAGLGAFGYTLEFLLGWQGSIRRWSEMPWLVLAYGFLVIPVSVASIVLIILQPVAVGAWCSWCLATAIIMLFMIVLSAGEFVAVLQLLGQIRKSKKSVWQAFWKGVPPNLAPSAKPRKTLKFSFGFSLPWNLIATAVLGIWLMASPSIFQLGKNIATANFIVGPLVVTFSAIAFAEVFRTLRYLNVLFGLSLVLMPCIVAGAYVGGDWSNEVTGILIAGLSLRKGPVYERYGSWESLIR